LAPGLTIPISVVVLILVFPLEPDLPGHPVFPGQFRIVFQIRYFERVDPVRITFGFFSKKPDYSGFFRLPRNLVTSVI
jgi:hypothetical protein